MNMSQGRFVKFTRLIPIVVILILSFIPVVLTWGRVVVGGDTTIPFDSAAISKFLYQWIGVQNGSYFSVNFYPLYFFYKIAEILGLSFYQISSLLLFVLSLVAGLGVYRLTRLYFKSGNYFDFIFPIAFYMMSPALLNSWHYLYIYSFSPWFIYLLVSFVKKKEINTVGIIFLNIIIFCASMDLPNPKYIFFLLLSAITIAIISYITKLVDIKFLVKVIWAIGISLLLSAYLILPLANFALRYTPSNYGVTVNPGNQGTDSMLDSGSATINKMFAVHHSGVNINKDERDAYLKNPLITLTGYVYLFVIIADIFRAKKNKGNRLLTSHKLIFLALIVLFLILSTGPNPPFGYFYMLIVTKVKPLAFLRTTAGAVFFLGLFYSVYIFIFLQTLKKYKNLIQAILIIAVLVTGYPLINGDFFENNTNINQFASKDTKGFKLASDYFGVSPLINNQKVDSKTYYPGMDSSYIYTNWGYFGPMFYTFAYNTSPISDNMIIYNRDYHNIGLTFLDLTAVQSTTTQRYFKRQPIYDGKIVKLFQTSQSNFLPHFYTPKIVSSNYLGPKQNEESSPSLPFNVRSAVYPNKTNLRTVEIQDLPHLEFKKINPTKYRIVVHDAFTSFPLIFSESFNSGWNIFVTDMEKLGRPKEEGLQTILQKVPYKILVGNETNQATKEELISFVKNGLVTDLGDGRIKKNNYYKWENAKKILDYTEDFSVDFISKNFQDTIQNDNLRNGHFYETWFSKPIQADHQVVNGYANSWIIDPSSICSFNKSCIKNEDGSFDFEITVEFWPQKLFYIGVGISTITVSTILILLAFGFLRKRKISFVD